MCVKILYTFLLREKELIGYINLMPVTDEFYNRFKDGKTKDFRVHRLVAQHFIKNDGGKRDVNHKNGIKTDNRACNLEWLTHSENERHKIYELKTPSKLFGTPRPVVCLNTGKVYKSISEAKRSLGLPKSSHVQEVCAGKLKQSNGYRWSYYDG